MKLIPKFKQLFEATEDELMDMPLEPTDGEMPPEGEEGEMEPEVDLFDQMANFVTNLDIDALVAGIEDPEAADALRSEYEGIVQALADQEEGEEGEEEGDEIEGEEDEMDDDEDQFGAE